MFLCKQTHYDYDYDDDKHSLCRRAVSVRLSCWVFVMFVHCVETSKRILQTFSPHGSHTILVFRYQTLCLGFSQKLSSLKLWFLFMTSRLWLFSEEDPHIMPASMKKKLRFPTNVSLYLGNGQDRAIVSLL